MKREEEGRGLLVLRGVVGVIELIGVVERLSG
jgi:hypothetical protein